MTLKKFSITGLEPVMEREGPYRPITAGDHRYQAGGTEPHLPRFSPMENDDEQVTAQARQGVGW